MTTERKLRLENAIEDWLKGDCEDAGFYWPEDTAARLATLIEVSLDFTAESVRMEKEEGT